MLLQFGLIGQSLLHSFSKPFFTKLFLDKNINAVYNNYDIANEFELSEFLLHSDCTFCNVTMPYKIQIKNYLHALTPEAQLIESVNCIKKVDGKWIGNNTDAIGFLQSFVPYLQAHHTHALIIGNGGAAKAVKTVLRKLNIPFIVVARSAQIGCIGFADIDAAVMEKYKIIINTTPLGMYPEVQSLPPIPYQFITAAHLLFDLIYNPTETIFLKNGKQNGATTANGMQMLELQASAAWEWWQVS
jgi:shikimate dehydrogenase